MTATPIPAPPAWSAPAIRDLSTLNDLDFINCGTAQTSNSDKCLVWENTHDITISNSTFATESWIGNYFIFDSPGSRSNFTFTGNDFSHNSGAMWFASAQGNTSEHNITYTHNTFHDYTSQIGGGVHGDGAMHYFSVPAGDSTQFVDGVTFCDNRFYGDFRNSFSGGGAMTAFFFTEGGFSGVICNNDMSFSPVQASMFDSMIVISANGNSESQWSTDLQQLAGQYRDQRHVRGNAPGLRYR